MLLPLALAGPSLGLNDWLQGSEPPLAVAAHPSGVLVALARGQVLAVLPLLPEHGPQEQRLSCPIHHSKQVFSALAWFAQLRPQRRGTPSPSPRQQGSPQQQAPAGSNQQQQQQQQQQAPPRCSVDAAEALLECDVLLSGTSEGHMQIHSSSGQLLFKQRLHGTAVLDIHLRPHCSGLRSSDAAEEVCVTFSNALVRISALDLRSQVRMLQLAQASGIGAAATIGPLPHTRYEIPQSVGPRVSGLCFGLLPPELYGLLSSSAGGGAGRQAKQKVCIVTVGRSPCLAAFEAEEQPSRSTLAALIGLASSLTTGMVGAASKAAGLGPSMVYAGMRSLMRPLSSWYAGADADASQQAAVAFDDLQAAPKPEPLSLTRVLRDDERLLEGLVPAPAGPLLVAPDNLGRVLLLDGASMAAVRIWKGYRDAQCGWLLPPPGHPASPLGLLLVLFAPKRQVLEVWLARAGQRLASRHVDYPCKLLSVGLPCGGWGNAAAWAAWQGGVGSATTLVLDVQSGTTWDALDCLLEE